MGRVYQNKAANIFWALCNETEPFGQCLKLSCFPDTSVAASIIYLDFQFCAFVVTLPEGCVWLLWDKSDITVPEQHGMADDVTSCTCSLIFSKGWKANNMLFFPLTGILYIPSLSKVHINTIQLKLAFHNNLRESWRNCNLASETMASTFTYLKFLGFQKLKTISVLVPQKLSVSELSLSKITI